jgi:ribosomal protein S18 acetylase RimI-like enzyme
MNYIEKKKKKRIKLNSDAFPKNITGKLDDKIYALSEIHDKIKYEELLIDKDQIYFKELTKHNLTEIVKLHREWFPVEYTNEFFLNLFARGSNYLANHIIGLGAFFQVDNKEYIIGSILCEFKSEKNFYNSTKIKIKKKSLCEKLFSSFEFCYIMTIGVIDECRNMGLGTRLLNEVISNIREKRKRCMAIYLHVIDYNISAIRFYLKNEFIECNNIRNYYFINRVYYHGKVLCKLFSNELEKEISVSESISNLAEPDLGPNFLYTTINSIINFASNVFCCCRNKNK